MYPLSRVRADPANPRAQLSPGISPSPETLPRGVPGLWNKIFMIRKTVRCGFREPDLGNAGFPSSHHDSGLLPSKARLCSGFFQASIVPDPGQMGAFPVCLLHWLWGFNTQFVIQMLDVELQVLFPWPDAKDAAGNMSGILGFWSPVTGTAAKRPGLTSREGSFYSGV